MAWKRFRYKSLLVTFVLLAGAWLATRMVFGPNPAFFPWPWTFYVPLIALVGLIDGVAAGIAAAGLAIAFHIFSLSFVPEPPPFPAKPFLVFALTGLASGAAGEWARHIVSDMQRAIGEARDRAAMLWADNRALAQSNFALRDRVSTRACLWSALRQAAPGLFSNDESHVLRAALSVGATAIGARKAAVYVFEPDTHRFHRQSSWGVGPANALWLPATATPFKELLDKPRLLTVRDLPLLASQSPHWVAAAPLTGASGLQGVLLVESLPLMRLTVDAMAAFRQWAEVASTALEAQAGRAVVERERRAEEQRPHAHASVVQMEISDFERHALHTDSRVLVEEIIRVVEKTKRKSDTVSYHGLGRFAVLMPGTTADRVHPFISRTQEEARALFQTESKFSDVGLNFQVSERVVVSTETPENPAPGERASA